MRPACGSHALHVDDTHSRGETAIRVTDWKVEIGRELARQCPSLVVLVVLCWGFLNAQRAAFHSLETRLDRLTAAVERMADGRTTFALPRFDASERAAQ